MVLWPERFVCSRSLGRTLRRGHLETRLDRAFGATIRACAGPRRSGSDTWLDQSMIAAYETLHHLGIAHSVETYAGGELVGGLYGVHLGGVFFGESMFSHVTDASKVALARLVAECRSRDIRLIDCQVASSHLASLGAAEMPRAEFIAQLALLAKREPRGRWGDTAP